MQSINKLTSWRVLEELTKEVHGESWEQTHISRGDFTHTLKVKAGLVMSLGRLIHLSEFVKNEEGLDELQTEMVILMVHRLDAHGVVEASFYPVSLQEGEIDYPRQSVTFSMDDSYEKRELCGWVPSLQEFQSRFCSQWMESIAERYAIEIVQQTQANG